MFHVIQRILFRWNRSCRYVLFLLALVFVYENIKLGLEWRTVSTNSPYLFSLRKEWRQPSIESTVQFEKIIDGVEDSIPPLLYTPPQENNQYESFTTQVLKYNLNAYQRSPRIVLPIPSSSNSPPHILHFIFIALNHSIGNGEFVAFNFMNYLVIRAAYLRLQPKEIYLHLSKPPLDSPYWRLIKPMITQVKTFKPITSIYNRMVSGPAHMSDIGRLLILQQYGGMYMDIDSLSLRPFPSEYWDPMNGLMMGFQNQKSFKIGVGVIVARKESVFLKRWLASYKTFDDTQWDTHTVVMAGTLAKQYPDEINLVSRDSFYNPSWIKKSLKHLWQVYPLEKTDLFPFRHTIAPHFWGTIARKEGYVQRMNPYTVLHENSGINQILRALVPDPFFTITINCTNWTPRLLKDTLMSIVSQTFALFEILVIDSAECKAHIEQLLIEKEYELLKIHQSKHVGFIPSTIKVIQPFTRGVWMVQFQAGEQFHSRTALFSALELMREDVSAFEVRVPNEKPIVFIFNESIPIVEINRIP